MPPLIDGAGASADLENGIDLALQAAARGHVAQPLEERAVDAGDLAERPALVAPEGQQRPERLASWRAGVIVRPLAGFGAPGAIRVTVGTPDENVFLAEALADVAESATTG